MPWPGVVMALPKSPFGGGSGGRVPGGTGVGAGTGVSGAGVGGADVGGAGVGGADVGGADVGGAAVGGADVAGAEVAGAAVGGAGVAGAGVSGACVAGAEVSGAWVSGANVSGGNVSGAGVEGGSVRGAGGRDLPPPRLPRRWRVGGPPLPLSFVLLPPLPPPPPPLPSTTANRATHSTTTIPRRIFLICVIDTPEQMRCVVLNQTKIAIQKNHSLPSHSNTVLPSPFPFPSPPPPFFKTSQIFYAIRDFNACNDAAFCGGAFFPASLEETVELGTSARRCPGSSKTVERILGSLQIASSSEHTAVAAVPHCASTAVLRHALFCTVRSSVRDPIRDGVRLGANGGPQVPWTEDRLCTSQQQNTNNNAKMHHGVNLCFPWQ